jgi:hypothetical protein
VAAGLAALASPDSTVRCSARSSLIAFSKSSMELNDRYTLAKRR